ncbi:MAG: DNA-directed RNA polymerase [Nanoarchaeota archaeon]|nr:DNA-directed RNA polymerase [Nanoarchaeota archaeon]MBU1103723.1 DNA-directed RNA polymerase [Nanoarchaeota archaeon]
MGRFDSRNDRSRSGGFNRGPRSDSQPREMHKAVCDECKKECEVPFKPTEGKKVYCRECFARRNPR